jgi:hypothetical protein
LPTSIGKAFRRLNGNNFFTVDDLIGEAAIRYELGFGKVN